MGKSSQAHRDGLRGGGTRALAAEKSPARRAPGKPAEVPREEGHGAGGAKDPARRATKAPAKTRGKSAARKRGRASKVEPAERRQAILEAALTVFAERGFEAARLDDVAARAGVAKGTLYLYFKDKETLFEELLRGAVSPLVERIGALSDAPDVPFANVLDTLYSIFQREVLNTHRKLLIRLVIAEGPRFPRIAEAHYRNVVSRIMPLLQKIAQRAVVRGELASDAVARFPQLIAAPLVTAVIWDGLFAKIQPLDTASFFSAYREVLIGKPRGPLS
jgi:AcrR family transcriptional regulator